jgi:hypothetical protein
VNNDLNAALRAAAGRTVVSDTQTQIETREKVGEIGIGRGGACASPPPPDPTAQINERIRLAARQATNWVDIGVDLDDVL